MNGTWTSLEGWLLQSALGGGLLLWLTWRLVLRTTEPARQQRLAEWGLTAALLAALLSAGPTWLKLPAPPTLLTSRSMVQTETTTTSTIESEWASEAMYAIETPKVQPHVATQLTTTSGPPAWKLPEWHELTTFAGRGVLLLYVAVAGVLLLRWLAAALALIRLVAVAETPPLAAALLFESMLENGPRARLLVSRSLRVPVSFGLLRPTVLIPAAWCDARELRWVFAHELTHLRRRDPWTCVLFALGEIVFFYLPWFWTLRRQVRLCQEYLADAAVADHEVHPEDYAEFLLSLAPAPIPLGTASMSGSSSDLFRRISRMLTERTSKVENRRPWTWTVVCGLLALAVVVSGVGLNAARTVADEPKPEEPKKEAPKNDKKEQPKPKAPVVDPFEGVGDLDELFRKLGAGDEDGIQEFQKEMQKQLELLRKAMGVRGRAPGVMPFPEGFPGLPFGGVERGTQQGRLGVMVEKPTDTLAEQLDLPKDQGLVVRGVVPDSAADKAGLKEHDILLEIAGKPVPNETTALVKLLDGFKADEKFDVLVLRKGRRETLKEVTLPAPKVAKKPQAFNPFGGLPDAVPGKNATTTLIRNGDEFTATQKVDGVSLKLSGTVTDGKANLGSVTIEEGETSKEYDSLDKVPEAHREQVKKLLEMAGKGSVKIEIRN